MLALASPACRDKPVPLGLALGVLSRFGLVAGLADNPEVCIIIGAAKREWRRVFYVVFVNTDPKLALAKIASALFTQEYLGCSGLGHLPALNVGDEGEGHSRTRFTIGGTLLLCHASLASCSVL